MKKIFLWTALLLLCIESVHAHVVCTFRGRLGNQLFQAAAALSLAQEHDCAVYFPDFERLDEPTEDYGLQQLKTNYKYIFSKIPKLQEKVVPSFIYTEPDFFYHPIDYQEDTEIIGYFISEKHFKKHKDLIVDLFSPSSEIEQVLIEKFDSIIHHPNSVGIHVRTGFLEYALNGFDETFYKAFLAPDLAFFEKAIEMFDEDALFVVFSDHIDWCKEHFSHLNRNFVFIEEQEYIYDFYLLSKCRHAIFANSTFSWWAAYLNKNPNKRILCRKPFWICDLDVACPGWTEIEMPDLPPPPHFTQGTP